VSNELKYAGKIPKPECLSLLAEYEIPHDPKALVAELRDLLVEAGLASAEEPKGLDIESMVSLVGVKKHKCEMAGDKFDFVEKTNFEAKLWQAEKLVKFGVARYA
jgi:hypothetical protein